MQNWKIAPGIGVGPITLGMSRQAAIGAAEAQALPVRSHTRWASAPPSLVIGAQLQAHFDDIGRIVEIEVARASSPEHRRLLLGDIDISAADAKDVLESIATQYEVDRDAREYPSTSVFPRAGLTLWKEGKPGELEEGPFQAVSVFVPSE